MHMTVGDTKTAGQQISSTACIYSLYFSQIMAKMFSRGYEVIVGYHCQSSQFLI